MIVYPLTDREESRVRWSGRLVWLFAACVFVVLFAVSCLFGCGTEPQKWAPTAAIRDLCEYEHNSLCQPRPGCSQYCRGCADQWCAECCWDGLDCCGNCDWWVEYQYCMWHCCTDLQ